jgi:hypothetical protein
MYRCDLCCNPVNYQCDQCRNASKVVSMECVPRIKYVKRSINMASLKEVALPVVQQARQVA